MGWMSVQVVASFVLEIDAWAVAYLRDGKSKFAMVERSCDRLCVCSGGEG